MYTVVLDQNWVRCFFRSIGYPIGPPSKLCKDNQATIKRVLAYRINPRVRPLDVLITALHELQLRKTFEMVDTRSNIKLADLNSKSHGRKSLWNIIDHAIGIIFYPPPGSLHYQLLRLGQLHGSSHINCEQKKKGEVKKTLISSVRNRTTKARVDQI